MFKWCCLLLALMVFMPGCGEADAPAADAPVSDAAGEGPPMKAKGLIGVLQPPDADNIAEKRGTEKLLGRHGRICAVADKSIDDVIAAYKKLGRTKVESIGDPNSVRVPWADWSDSKSAVLLIQFKGHSWTEVLSPKLNAKQLSETIGGRVVVVSDAGWYGPQYELWTRGEKLESFQGKGEMPYRESEHGGDWEAPSFYSKFRDVDFKTIKMTDGQFVNDFVKGQGAYMGLCMMQPDYMGNRDENGRPSLKLTWPHETFPEGIIARAVLLQ